MINTIDLSKKMNINNLRKQLEKIYHTTDNSLRISGTDTKHYATTILTANASVTTDLLN